MKMINIGCGQTPIKGWVNYDNSMSLHLARFPFLFQILKRLGVLNKKQEEFILFAMSNKIKFADATKTIPGPNGSVAVLYSSHMFEHLDRDQVKLFLKEARRILIKGGIIRIVVPDIKMIVEKYLNNKDADAFVEATLLTNSIPNTYFSKLKYLILGNRNHQWMYDGESLCKLLLLQGFLNAQIMKAGATNIPDPGELNLFEHFEGSVYVEATK